MIDCPIQQHLVHHFLEKSAELYPDKCAVVHEKNRATYAQINAAANSLASFLRAKGIDTGDCVVLVHENSIEYIVCYYGILKAGAIAVPLSTDIKPDGFNPLIQELEPAAVIGSSRFEKLFSSSYLSGSYLKILIINKPKMNWRNKVPIVHDLSDITAAPGSNLKEATILPDDLASIIYTSGSTGKPKGVMLSHRAIVTNTHDICDYLKLRANDIQMVVLPFFYVMGKSLLNTHFAIGGTVVINNKFAFPASVLMNMVEEKVTGFSGVPSTYAYLLNRSPLADYRDKLPALRYCSQAGGHMAQSIKKQLRSVLPDHTQIYIMYGATEASARLTYLHPDHFSDKIESIGKPLRNVRLKIMDENGIEVAAGQKGEIVASGHNIMKGYWKDPESTERALDSNGYHTGDLGYMDPQGFYYVVGRRDNLIKVGGHRINPQEIEDTLLATNLVLESAVFGIPDKLMGYKMVALVSPIGNTVTANQLMQICASKLPKYKLPSQLRMMRSLPKNSNGKIARDQCMAYIKAAEASNTTNKFG